jgi:serine/threonine protein phosphatase PrpC
MYQEDRLVARKLSSSNISGWLLAVADGHGGDETSSLVEGQLSKGLFDRLLAKGRTPNNAMKMTFQYLKDLTSEQNNYTGRHQESGTTLSLVFVPIDKKRAHVGVIGDSPVIIARKDGTIHVSPEHNARSNKKERVAAEKRGGKYLAGYIYSVSGDSGLQMTRDIGYYAMGDVVARHPDLYDMSLDEGDVIIVASDGLVDPGHTSNRKLLKTLAGLALRGADAQELVEDAIQRQTGDNVTAIVFRC